MSKAITRRCGRKAAFIALVLGLMAACFRFEAEVELYWLARCRTAEIRTASRSTLPLEFLERFACEPDPVLCQSGQKDAGLSRTLRKPVSQKVPFRQRNSPNSSARTNPAWHREHPRSASSDRWSPLHTPEPAQRSLQIGESVVGNAPVPTLLNLETHPQMFEALFH